MNSFIMYLLLRRTALTVKNRTHVSNGIRLIAAIFIVIGTIQNSIAQIPMKKEADYLEAVLSFRSREFEKAIQQLGPLVQEHGNVKEFLELLALSLKAAGENSQAAQIYEKLVNLKKKQKATYKEIAPYRFELGVLQFKDKNFAGAKSNLTYAYRSKFNTGAARFFLGMITFQEGAFEEAKTHFEKSLAEKISELELVSRFYLGQVEMKLGNLQLGVYQFNQCRTLATQQIADIPETDPDRRKMPQTLLDATSKILDPMDKLQFYANLTLNTGYDSNVLYLPETSATEASGKTSFKETASLALGMLTSPLRLIQFVPGYRFNGNYNFNRALKSAEYLSNAGSLYLNWDPMAPIQFGIKTDVSHTLKNNGNLKTSEIKYETQSITGLVGPYFRFEPISKIKSSTEINATYLKDYTDNPKLPKTIRTGPMYQARTSLDWNRALRWFNPSLSFSYTMNQAKGTESRTRGWGTGIGNVLNITPNLRASLNFGIDFSKYPFRSGGVRSDSTLSGSIFSSYKLSRYFTILADFQYTKNNSNLPKQYKYQRFSGNLGVSVGI